MLAAGAPPVDPEEGSVVPWDALGVVEGVLPVGVGVEAGGVLVVPSVVVAVAVAVLDAVVVGALVVALAVIESVAVGGDITVVDVSVVVAPALVAAGSPLSLLQPSSVPARAAPNTVNTPKDRGERSAARRVDDECGAKHEKARRKPEHVNIGASVWRPSPGPTIATERPPRFGPKGCASLRSIRARHTLFRRFFQTLRCDEVTADSFLPNFSFGAAPSLQERPPAPCHVGRSVLPGRPTTLRSA